MPSDIDIEAGEDLRVREGMRVVRIFNYVYKIPEDRDNVKAVWNAIRFFSALRDTGYVPRCAEVNPDTDTLRYEYICETSADDTIMFQERFRRNCIHLIFLLKKYGIRHGDLTRPNYIVNGCVPVVIDWDQSNFVWEEMPQKRPQTDAYHLYASLPDVILDTNRVMRRWLAVREHIYHLRGYGRLNDFGCFEGDFTALAQSEGFLARGIDNGSIHSDCIDNAIKCWSEYGCEFYNSDFAADILSEYAVYRGHVALLFSTWPYVVEKYGKDRAIKVLKSIIDNHQYTFFETQLYLDGPGPEWLKTDEDTRKLLESFNHEIEPIVSIPVTGRDAIRTVWKVTNEGLHKSLF